MNEQELRVLIVDDEKIDRDAYRLMLSKGLPWLRVIGEVENGLDAVRFCCDQAPDIVLMDIHMPKISGLEAIRLLRAEGSDISFVIISAYDYFEHAKEALDLGVLGFMVKPVSETDLIREMHRVSAIVEKKKMRLIDRLNNMGNACAPIQAGDELFYAIRMGAPDMIRALQKARGIVVESGMIAIVESDRAAPDEMIPWLCRRCKMIECVLWNEGRLCVLMLQKTDPGKLKEMLGSICSEAQLRFQLRLRFFISDAYHSLRDVVRSYMQAVSMMNCKGTVCCFHPDMHSNYPYPFDSELRLIEAMQCRDSQRSAEILAMIQDEVNDHFAHGRFERQKLILFDLFITFNRQELRANAEDNTEMLDISSYMRIPDVDGLRAYFQECLCLLIGRSHRIQAPDHMRPILDYIHANYNRNVPLSVLASRFFYSQGYLGRVLKEATGLSYIEYVTRLRVEHAMTLLKSSPKSIAEISSEVGYKDPNYFSKVFKRMCSKTPQAFRSEAGSDPGEIIR